MIPQAKKAVVYGAGGSLGEAISKALAAAGATVFLTGRNLASVEKVKNEILHAGGKAEADEVDAFDGHAVDLHLEMILQKAASVDISFNAVGIDVIQGTPLADLSIDDYVRPVTQTLQTRFLTAKAAGRIMKRQHSGVILTLTATPGGIGYPYTGGFAPACCAVENFSRNLAAELGVYGVRVVNIRSGGSPDSKVFRDAIHDRPEIMEEVFRAMENDTMLKKLPLMADIANTAVFLASDMAAKITGVTIDVTAGTTAGLNYRVLQ